MLVEAKIRKIEPNRKLADDSLARAKRDIETSETLIENEKFDWALAVAYNSMLQSGRALMFNSGYRPASTKGHVAVVEFLHEAFGIKISDRLITVMNGLRKKRHRIVYEESDIVSESEAEQAVKWAKEFLEVIKNNLK